MNELLTFLLMVTGPLSRQPLNMSPRLLNTLPHPEKYYGIHNSLPHPSFYL